VERIKEVNSGKLIAFCDICIMDAFIIKGLKIIRGANGLFVSMPSEKGRDNKYYDTVFPKTKEIREELERIVLAEYNKDKVAPEQQGGFEEEGW
ncbi:MAG: SpoVG family protein, partial [Gammaproteobacteria bacterium]|nr:SpoVG family protein [Gammaproteobacteria bacterium]